MAFCFTQKESVSKAIRRLSRERLEDALDCLKDCRDEEAIHCARKDIKKTRAVLRLVRPKLRKFRRLTKPLRQAAKRLAGPRDAFVMVNTLTHLTRHFQGQLAPAAFRQVRLELRNACEDEMQRFAKEKATKVAMQKLRRAVQELERLRVDGKGWKALSPGVKSAYSDGRLAYRTSLKEPSSENFHKWRKRAKDLWYQVRLLERVWPEQMEAIAGELEKLGEYLGDDHDLVVLRQVVAKRATDKLRPRELETLNRLIEQRQRQLRAAALGIGKGFYAEKSASFCKRIAGYWKLWRRNQKPSARRNI